MSRNNDIWLRKPAGLVLGLDFSGGRIDSPTGHSGTLGGNATVAAGTRYLALDGVGDRLDFADAPEFSFTSGGGVDLPFSFSAWVYLAAHSALHYLCIKGSEYQIILGHPGAASKGLTIILYKPDYSAYIGRRQGANTGILTGAWFHVATTYSGSKTAAGIQIFVAGSNVAGTAVGSGVYPGVSNTTAGVTFGWVGFAQDASRFADIRLYNRVLASGEISQIYNAGAARIAQGGTP